MLAHEGIRYLAANDSPASYDQPSISQVVYLSDGRYLMTFGIWLRSRAAVERQARLVIWEYYNGVPSISAHGSLITVTNEWKQDAVQAYVSGLPYRCEVYWYDHSAVDIMFDGAYCYVDRLN